MINIARPVIYTATEFNKLIDGFIAYCDANNSLPDDYTLVKFSDNKLSYRTLDRMFGASSGEDNDSEDVENTQDDESKKVNYKAYGEAIKKLIAYREHYNMVEAERNPKAIGHINFRIKQGRWGKWTDKMDVSGAQQINIHLGLDASKSE